MLDGYAFFVGRISDMIKTNSANVSRLEVEAALNSSVRGGVVARRRSARSGARRNRRRSSRSRRRREPDEADLRAALRETLSSFKIPRRIVFITHDDVPRTPTGKVRLSELTELITAHLAAQARTHHVTAAGG